MRLKLNISLHARILGIIFVAICNSVLFKYLDFCDNVRLVNAS